MRFLFVGTEDCAQPQEDPLPPPPETPGFFLGPAQDGPCFMPFPNIFIPPNFFCELLTK